MPHSDFATEGPQPMEGNRFLTRIRFLVSAFDSIHAAIRSKQELLFLRLFFFFSGESYHLFAIRVLNSVLKCVFFLVDFLLSSAADGSCKYGGESASGGSAIVKIHVDD